MFHTKASKGLHEMVLDGQVSAPRVPKAGSRSRQCSLSLNGRGSKNDGYVLEYSSSRDVNINSQGCNSLSRVFDYDPEGHFSTTDRR